MKSKINRIKERSKKDILLDFLHSYAYVETLIILFLYLAIGYLIDSTDICILNNNISYLTILLAIITLFHGFENGILSVGIISSAMWYFYPSFPYVEFLSVLLMTMIFSEFHYYWTQKIKNAEINSNYRGEKLDELSKAFYTLKISHDQLEKNYVIKPMSIRNSIEYIIEKNKEVSRTLTYEEAKEKYYTNFLELIEKSFNVNSAAIIYKKSNFYAEYITAENSNMVLNNISNDLTIEELMKDYLVDQSLGRGTAIYISDTFGDPTINNSDNSDFLAAIPSVRDDKPVAVLVIKKMPFMSFNREILTSISILLDYFSVEIRKKDALSISDEIKIIEDEAFRFEYDRLKKLYKKYNVNSIVLSLRVESELQAIRIYETNQKLLRSLDLVTQVQKEGYFHIVLMFPLHDKSSALGYLNRLINFLDKEDKDFRYMAFNLSQTNLLNKYLSEKPQKVDKDDA